MLQVADLERLRMLQHPNGDLPAGHLPPSQKREGDPKRLGPTGRAASTDRHRQRGAEVTARARQAETKEPMLPSQQADGHSNILAHKLFHH